MMTGLGNSDSWDTLKNYSSQSTESTAETEVWICLSKSNNTKLRSA